MISSAQGDSGFPVVIGLPSDNAEEMTCRWNKEVGEVGDSQLDRDLTAR